MTLTIRLTETEERELARIQDFYNEKTASKAIKGMIIQFMDIREAAKESTFNVMKLQKENAQMKDLILERQATKNTLNNIQSRLTKIAKP